MIPLPSHPGLIKNLRSVKGIGPQLEKALNKRGFFRLEDLLFLMPSKYQDRRKITPIRQVEPEMDCMLAGEIVNVREGRFSKSGRRYFEMTVADETGEISALWFSFPAHLRKTTEKGRPVVLFGRVQAYKDRLQIVHPEILAWESSEKLAPEIRPVYPEMDDIKPGTLRRIMAEAASQLSAVPGIFPSKWLEAEKVTDPVVSIHTLHSPPADRPGALPKPEQSRAWRSLALFELLFIQITLAESRKRQSNSPGWSYPVRPKLVQAYLEGLPFKLTEDQKVVLDEIWEDMARPNPMNRLLQGDVGSGKTVVAAAAALTAVAGSRQAAIMAPTEMLARQHYNELSAQMAGLDVPVELLVGSLPEAEKKLKRERIASGETRLVIGTQALIASGLEFNCLGMVVIDEQHRFGVAQRLALRSKADTPDILVMTATPIPRSLAMTLYGDLDLSVIKGLPPGRKSVETLVFRAGMREKAYEMLKAEIENGGQAYVVAPHIEAREDEENGEDPIAVESVYEKVKNAMPPGTKVGLVHGRMKTEEQQAVMTAFRRGEISVLAATTVIEVGVDVPNASLILIEGADRFGLAQLHQLRGRVGRGNRPSKCLLTAERAESDFARLDIMASTNDGFILAEEDLKIRGPGDQTGLRQSGLPPLTWARLPRDLPVLLKAREMAGRLVESREYSSDDSYKLVREAVERMKEIISAELTSIG